MKKHDDRKVYRKLNIVVTAALIVFLLFGGADCLARETEKEVLEISIDIAEIEPGEWVEYGPYCFEKREAWSAILSDWEKNDTVYVAYGLDREHIISDYEFNDEIKGIGVSMYKAGDYYFYLHNASDHMIENIKGKFKLYIKEYPE